MVFTPHHPFVKEVNQDLKQDMLLGGGGDFSQILVGGTKRGESMFCDSSVGGTCRG